MNRIALIALFAFAPLAMADVESGPKAGEKVAELKVFAVTGTHENKEVDYAKDRGDQPTVFLFVNKEKFSRPMNQFIKTLDGKLAGIDEKLVAVAVWVGKDSDASKEFLPKIQKSVQYEKTALTVYTADEKGPNGWALNTDAHLTVVVVKGGKVVKSFAYDTVNEKDVKDVEAVLKEKK